MTAILLRRAEPEDAAALGALHVACWREAYAGLLPDQLLRDLSVEARSTQWRTVLADRHQPADTSVFAAEDAGRLVGFGACGRQRDEALDKRGFDAEVGALYVLRSHQRRGVGRTLMGQMADDLLRRGRTAAFLWVLSGNVAGRAFYERLGGVLLTDRTEEEGGF